MSAIILKEAAVEDLQRLIAKLQREGFMSEYALAKLNSAIAAAGSDVETPPEPDGAAPSLTNDRIVSIFYPMGTATENQKHIALAIGRAIERVVIEAAGGDYAQGYIDALDHAAFYVYDHCKDGEDHAQIIRELKRPDRVTSCAPPAERLTQALRAYVLLDEQRGNLKDKIYHEAQRALSAYTREGHQLTEEMIRAALAVQWPALYRESLFKDADGPSFRGTTQQRIEVIRKQWQAMQEARGGQLTGMTTAEADRLLIRHVSAILKGDGSADATDAEIRLRLIGSRNVLASARRLVEAGWSAALKCHSHRGMAGWSSHREEYLREALDAATSQNNQGEQA